MLSYFSLMYDYFGRLFLAGIMFTLPLAILSFLGGLIVAFLVAIIRLYSPQPIRGIANFYVWIIRGTPLLVQLFLIFYGLPNVGITLDAFSSALIGFTLNVGAYTSEIIRGSIISVPKEQWEAAWSLGMNSTQAMFRIILPQSIFFSLPSLTNSFISLIKDTSLAAIITVPEMFLSAQRIVSVTYEPLLFYIEVAAVYLFYSTILSKLQNFLENYYRRYE